MAKRYSRKAALPSGGRAQVIGSGARAGRGRMGKPSGRGARCLRGVDGPAHQPRLDPDVRDHGLARHPPARRHDLHQRRRHFSVWLHRFHRYRRFGTQIAPICGSMGYGIPAAVAAKLARPDATVVSATQTFQSGAPPAAQRLRSIPSPIHSGRAALAANAFSVLASARFPVIGVRGTSSGGQGWRAFPSWR